MQPCRCSGTIAHVHKRCLHRWCSTPPFRARCDVCLTKFGHLPARLAFKARAAAAGKRAAIGAGVTAGLAVGAPLLAAGAATVGMLWGLGWLAEQAFHLAQPASWKRREADRRATAAAAAAEAHYLAVLDRQWRVHQWHLRQQRRQRQLFGEQALPG